MTSKSKDELLARYVQTNPERFISLLVHDVRVPLTSVVSAAKLIDALLDEDSEIDRAQIQEVLHMILQCTDDMRALLDVAVQYERIHQKEPSSK
jgi:signal transduction histidine kinase